MRWTFVTILANLGLLSYCQTPLWEWAKPSKQKVTEFSYIYRNINEVDRFGNFFTGEYQDSTCLLTKYNTHGSELWQKELTIGLLDIEVDNDGNIYAAGQDTWQGYKQRYPILLKFDPYGNMLWRKDYPSEGGTISSVAIRPDNSAVISGSFSGSLTIENRQVSAPNSCYFLAEIKPTGSLSWLQADTNLYMKSVDRIEFGNTGQIFGSYYYYSTKYPNDYGVVRFTAAGVFEAKKSIGNGVIGICLDDSNNVYTSCIASSWTSAGTLAVIKLNSKFQTIWSTQTGTWQGGDFLMYTQPQFGPDKQIYLAGHVSAQQVILGPDTIKVIDRDDLVVSRINSHDGKFSKSYCLAGNGNEDVIDFSIDILGNIYLMGIYTDTLCFDSHCLYAKTTNYINTTYIAKLKLSDKQFLDGVGIETLEKESFQFFPNPASDFLTIQLSDIKCQQSLELLNVTGGRIETIQSDQNHFLLDVSRLEAGVYFLKFKSDHHCIMKKFIVTD